MSESISIFERRRIGVMGHLRRMPQYPTYTLTEDENPPKKRTPSDAQWACLLSPFVEMSLGVQWDVEAASDYRSNWQAQVPDAIKNLSAHASEVHRELRIRLLEISVNRFKIRLKRLESIQSKIATINTFSPEQYSLKRPIIISVSTSGDEFTAAWQEVNLYGCGETEMDAINDLKNSILDLYDSLTSETELGAAAAQQRRILDEFLLKP